MYTIWDCVNEKKINDKHTHSHMVTNGIHFQKRFHIIAISNAEPLLKEYDFVIYKF